MPCSLHAIAQGSSSNETANVSIAIVDATALGTGGVEDPRHNLLLPLPIYELDFRQAAHGCTKGHLLSPHNGRSTTYWIRTSTTTSFLPFTRAAVRLLGGEAKLQSPTCVRALHLHCTAESAWGAAETGCAAAVPAVPRWQRRIHCAGKRA